MVARRGLDSGRYYTVTGRCNSSHRLLELGEKGVYPSYILTLPHHVTVASMYEHIPSSFAGPCDLQSVRFPPR